MSLMLRSIQHRIRTHREVQVGGLYRLTFPRTHLARG
jgi:hypothetical protein